LNYDYTERMLKIHTHFRNFLGGILKLLGLPLLLSWLIANTEMSSAGQTPYFLDWLLIMIGFIGMTVSTLMLFRFGNGHIHFEPRPGRLVDMGSYARTRHPNFWFFQIYLLGILLFYLGLHPLAMILWVTFIISGFLFLRFIQEPILRKHLGPAYAEYQKSVPLLYWKLRIPENRKVHFLALMVWFASRTVFRYWYHIKVKGTEHIPHSKPLLVIANHECFLDPFLFGIFIPFELRFVTTADVFSTPLMRLLLKGIGTFPMRRHRQDLTSIRTMIRMVKQGQVVGIFPEGGRSLYGEPLPILKETLKLIQACKVPILPVHLDGAYEIWPRWAPNRRRGRVQVTINPVIPVAAQSDLGRLEEIISESIFSPEKQFATIRSGSVAQGMEKLVWGCIHCRSLNSITLDSGNQISCRSCQSQWQVQNNYHLTDLRTGGTLSLIEWMHQIEDGLLDKAPLPELPLRLPSGERAYLFTRIGKYQPEQGDTIHGDLGLVLTDKRFILIRDDQEWIDWSIESVTVFTMDYFNAVSIGVKGLRHSFFLPPSEVTLKWQTFYEAIRDHSIQLDRK
jgi:1-acyl-sn-glycerol-3-phosphate acyltransferase